MNWTHSSKVIALGVLLAVSLVAVGSAAALDVVGEDPAPAEVGETVTHEVTIEEPFRDQPDRWDLAGQTDLESPSWTVHVEAQGDPVTTQDYTGESFTHSLDSGNGATLVRVEVSGEVPDLNTFDYRDMEAENYTAIGLTRGETELETFTGHRYTTGEGDVPGSQQARQAIDAAIESAGEDDDNVDRAISSYDNGNFQNAVSLADDASSGAQTMQLALIALGVVVVLGLVGGGVYYYREQQKTSTKLQ